MSDVSLELLRGEMQQMQAEIRALKRDITMLRAQTATLPTMAQFQAGLTAIDQRITELHAEVRAEIRALADLIRTALSSPP